MWIDVSYTMSLCVYVYIETSTRLHKRHMHIRPVYLYVEYKSVYLYVDIYLCVDAQMPLYTTQQLSRLRKSHLHIRPVYLYVEYRPVYLYVDVYLGVDVQMSVETQM